MLQRTDQTVPKFGLTVLMKKALGNGPAIAYRFV
jgi:hypothetical protein